jgi:hypothetical protein
MRLLPNLIPPNQGRALLAPPLHSGGTRFLSKSTPTSLPPGGCEGDRNMCNFTLNWYKTHTQKNIMFHDFWKMVLYGFWECKPSNYADSNSSLETEFIPQYGLFKSSRVWLHEKFLATYRQFNRSAPDRNSFTNKHNIYSVIIFCQN